MPVGVFSMFFTSQKININRSPNAAKLFGDFLDQKTSNGPEKHLGCPEGGTTHQGAPGPPGMPRWVMPPSGHPSGTSLSHPVSSVLEKFSKKFRCVWTPFGTDILRSKKKQKAATGTRHYVNRLVLENDIKLL